MSHPNERDSMPIVCLDPGDRFLWGDVLYEVVGINDVWDTLAREVHTGIITRVYPQMYVTVVTSPWGTAGV